MNNELPMANYVDMFLAVMAVHLAATFLTPRYLLLVYSVMMMFRLLVAYHYEVETFRL